MKASLGCSVVLGLLLMLGTGCAVNRSVVAVPTKQVVENQLTPPQIPEAWTYEAAVSAIGPTILKWKSLTVNILQQLYIAREMLSRPARTSRTRRG